MELTEIKKVTALAWRRFLLSEAGIEGQLVLRERAPNITPGESHNIVFQAGIVEGWKRAIEAMHEMIAVEKKNNETYENP